MAEELGERVVLDAPVRAIAWSTAGRDGRREHAGQGTRGDRRRPPNLVAAIRFTPALPAWRMRLQQASSQGSVTKILAVYPEPFWRRGRPLGEGFAPHQFVRELYDNTPRRVGRSALHVPAR
jgi:monoamine oxidase